MQPHVHAPALHTLSTPDEFSPHATPSVFRLQMGSFVMSVLIVPQALVARQTPSSRVRSPVVAHVLAYRHDVKVEPLQSAHVAPLLPHAFTAVPALHVAPTRHPVQHVPPAQVPPAPVALVHVVPSVCGPMSTHAAMAQSTRPARQLPGLQPWPHVTQAPRPLHVVLP